VEAGWRCSLGDLRLDGLLEFAPQRRDGLLVGRQAIDPVVQPACDRWQGEDGHGDDEADKDDRPQRERPHAAVLGSSKFRFVQGRNLNERAASGKGENGVLADVGVAARAAAILYVLQW